MSKELEDAKDKLLSNPNVSESMKIQWNQDQLGENILKKSFPSCKEQKWEEALQVAYAENGTVYKVIGDFTNYSNEQAKLRDQSIKNRSIFTTN